MTRGAAILAVVITALLGMACGGQSPVEPSPNSDSLPTPVATPFVEPTLTDQQFKDRLEALMLGTGPLADARNPGCFTGRYMRWTESLNTMRLVMSSKVKDSQRAALRSVFDTYREVLGGRPMLQEEIVEVVPPLPPSVVAQQVGVVTVDVLETLAPFCGTGSVGCFSGSGTNDTYSSGSIFLTTGASDWTAAHEAGHMAGMCHVIGIGSLTSVMSGATSPTSLDRRVFETVIRSGLRPGATRADFVAKGLL